MNADRTGQVAVVVGQGGIGRALADRLAADGAQVHRWSRATGIDTTDAVQLAAAADALGEARLDTVMVTTGMLHDARQSPEKSLRDLDAAALARSFAINTVAPTMAARALLPHLPRDRRAVFAALGARVGSIGDNRTGGWHGYRASKAALAMMIRTLAIELRRTHPQAICVLLHPGTVDTPMSAPFKRGVAADKLFTPDFSAERMLEVLARFTPEDSGGHYAWDGARIAE